MDLRALLWLLVACIFHASALTLLTPRWSRDFFQEQRCDGFALAAFRGKSRASPGLVISGHGGSSTRAIQEMVTEVGSHFFGAIDPETHDSLVTRWANVTDIQSEIFAKARQTDYDLSSIPQDLRAATTDDVCRSVLILDSMQEQSDADHGVSMSWALKEPWLRFVFPFFDDVVGPSGYKFVHVTRDIRSIHQRESETNRLPLPDKPEWGAQFNALASEANRRFPALEVTAKQVAFLAEFAHTWALTETRLKHWWETQRADQYFHISERNFATPEQARGVSARLVSFLGVQSLPSEKLEKMSFMFKPNAETDDSWHLMNMIINLKDMVVVRDALREFGYGTGIRQK